MAKENKKSFKDFISLIGRLFKTCTFQLIMLIITSIIGIWIILSSSLGYGLKLYVLTIVIVLIPVIVFGIALYRKNKYINNKYARSNINWFTTFVVLILPLYYVFALAFISIESVTTEVTNYRFYNDFMYKELYELFPRKLPKSAKDIKYYHQDPFLQGGEINVLYYIDDELDSKRVEDLFKKKAVWIGKVEDEEKPVALPRDIFNHAPIKGDYDDYIIYVIKERCDNSGYCNHGNYMFAAYNDKTKEIIYKQEHW